MDRKQRKAKKREEKKKHLRAKKQEGEQGYSSEEKKMGNIQLIVFGVVALAGVAIILIKV